MASITNCRSCGKRIRWIQTPAEKWMPVDAVSVRFVENPESRSVLILRDGTTARGDVVPDSEDGCEGYISHFATCPNADRHRRRAGA